MRKYVVKRIILAFITAFIILSATFLLMKLLPFSIPAGMAMDKWRYFQEQFQLGFVTRYDIGESVVNGVKIENIDQLKEMFGTPLFYTEEFEQTAGANYAYYQTPVFVQYGNFLANVFTKWNWGTSTYILPNASAISIIGDRLPVSISINIISVLISVPFGILLGIWAALKKNKPTDHIISTLIMVFISVPSFIIISLLIKWLAFDTGLLPWQWPDATSTSGQKALGYIIPVLALCFGSICGYCRFTRAELCEVMSSDYLLLARTKGLTKRQCIIRHALRNAMVPIVPSILAEFIGILSGSMILENLYNIPGIGSLFVMALNSKDYSVLMVDMAIFTLVSLVAGVILDISYGFIDPRIRMGAKNNG